MDLPDVQIYLNSMDKEYSEFLRNIERNLYNPKNILEVENAVFDARNDDEGRFGIRRNLTDTQINLIWGIYYLRALQNVYNHRPETWQNQQESTKIYQILEDLEDKWHTETGERL